MKRFLLCLAFAALLSASALAHAADVTNNDLIALLYSKGFEEIDVAEDGVIEVLVPFRSGNIYTVYIVVDQREDGSVWAIKTLHYVPVVIPEQSFVNMLKFSSAFDYLRAMGVSTYVVYRGEDSDLVIESYFPVEHAPEVTPELLEEYYQNSFRMVAANLEVLYEGSKCVLLNADPEARGQCLRRVDRRIGEYYQ